MRYYIPLHYATKPSLSPTFLLPFPPQGQDHSVQAEALELNPVLAFVEHRLLPVLHVLHGHKQTADHVEKLPEDAVCVSNTERGIN